MDGLEEAAHLCVCPATLAGGLSRSSLPFKGERDVGENQPSLRDEVRWCGLASSGLQNLECTTSSDRMPSLLSKATKNLARWHVGTSGSPKRSLSSMSSWLG